MLTYLVDIGVMLPVDDMELTIGKVYYVNNNPMTYRGCEAQYYVFAAAGEASVRLLEAELATRVSATPPAPPG